MAHPPYILGWRARTAMMEIEGTAFSNRQLKRILEGVCLALLIIAGGLLYIYRGYFHTYQFWPLLAPTAIVILLGMAGLYLYAARFYHDIFYSFLSVGWLTNAVYIFFEAFFPDLENNLKYNLQVYCLGLITTAPFYLASFISVDELPERRRFFISTLKWIGWLAGTFLLCYWIAAVKFPSLDVETKFSILTIGGIPFTVWILMRVGKCLRTRLDPETHGKWAYVFPLTFYVYAGLQPFYLLKLVPSLTYFIKFIFLFALIPKILNSIGALSIIRLDFAKVEEQLQRRSVLEDIGALTASIEHDIKNPLGVVEIELTRMREKYQSNVDIVSRINRLEEQRQRIFAATQIIPVLRGEKDYYEQFMEKTNVGDLINRSIKAVKKEMNTHGILFQVDGKPIYTRAYRPMLEQAIVNVLRNSVEAIREAKRERGVVDITLNRNTHSDKMINIDFTDNGCGIPEENIPKVIKLFTTRQDKKPNSGIGLFVSSRIIKVHGGKLEIQSTVGEGTTVSLVLPKWDPDNRPSS